MNLREAIAVSAFPAATERAERVIARCREIAAQTEAAGQITRTFLSAPMHAVHRLLRGWMEDAGMRTSIDNAGNLHGVLMAADPKAPRVLLGSHLDTVPNAGAFDGVLGVVAAVAVVEALAEPPPLTVEIVGFAEEEGVRFRKPFLGSLALTGRLDATLLALADADGITVAEAIRNFGLDPARASERTLAPGTAAYVELHIEQGPVLEAANAAAAQRKDAGEILGVVDAIAGQSRLLLRFTGQANHAGTTPMTLRHDALVAAAETIVRVEALARRQPGLVATVGRIEAEPNAANVIPGLVRITLDVRHATDEVRERAVADLLAEAYAAGRGRGVVVEHQLVLEQPAVLMDAGLVRLLGEAVARAGHTPLTLASGAGHDAMILAPHVPSAMLFLRSPRGLSHHPEEAVLACDVDAGLHALGALLALIAEREGKRADA